MTLTEHRNQNLIIAQKNAGMTDEQLATKCFMTVRQLSKYKANAIKAGHPLVWKALAEALEVEVESIKPK